MKPMEIGDALVLHEILISYACQTPDDFCVLCFSTRLRAGLDIMKIVLSFGNITVWTVCY
jgi:hypothetical protein